MTSPLTFLRDNRRARLVSVLLFVLWLATILYLASNHALSRDEVRAHTLAMSGDDFFGMFDAVRGEGHPLLWYAMLRTAYEVTGVALLQPVALAVAIAAGALLVWRSPFGPITLALILFGRSMTFDFSVFSRNYGISMLLMFAFAALYHRYRRRGIWLGLLLLLLANTNVHSMLVAMALLLFWLGDLIYEDGLRWTSSIGNLLLNALLAGLGMILCVATVYPLFNDALTNEPDYSFGGIARVFTLSYIHLTAPKWILTFLLFGSVAGLVRAPAAAFALLAAYFGFALLLFLVHGGSYRHSALVLCFAVSIYWIVLARDRAAGATGSNTDPARMSAAPWPGLRQFLNRPGVNYVVFCGQIAMLGLLLVQTVPSALTMWKTVAGNPPASQVRAFATYLKTRPDLRDAIIMAEPDFLIEPLPYFVGNPTYLLREDTFRGYVKFSRQGRLELSLDDVLARARELGATRQVPVVILVQARLGDIRAPTQRPAGYNWILNVDPEQVARFRAGTSPIGSFRGPSRFGEEFDAYLVRVREPATSVR